MHLFNIALFKVVKDTLEVKKQDNKNTKNILKKRYREIINYKL